MPEKSDLAKVDCVVLKEDVIPTDIKRSNLTTDCHFVHLSDGRVDLVKGEMVPIFDDYHDRKLTINRIQLSGGTRNPRNSKPEI